MKRVAMYLCAFTAAAVLTALPGQAQKKNKSADRSIQPGAGGQDRIVREVRH